MSEAWEVADTIFLAMTDYQISEFMNENVSWRINWIVEAVDCSTTMAEEVHSTLSFLCRKYLERN